MTVRPYMGTIGMVFMMNAHAVGKEAIGMKGSATAKNPFAGIEAQLGAPGATGIFVTSVNEASPHAKAGVHPGDIITQVDGTRLTDLKSFYAAMQPKKDSGDKVRRLEIARGSDGPLHIDIPVSMSTEGWDTCWVNKSRSTWQTKPDYEGAPEYGWAEGTQDRFLRCYLGEDRSGFEWVRTTRRGDLLEVEVRFCLGGGTTKEDQWDYYVHVQSTHRRDKFLSVVKTKYADGPPGGRGVTRQAELGQDGTWQATLRQPDGKETAAEYPAAVEAILTGYGVTLLPLTLPTKEGASVTCFGASDGSGRPDGRMRMECIGKRTVKVCGKDTEAWGYAWRHYGDRPTEEDEHFYVSPDRHIVRVDWGPGYGGCWAELVSTKQEMMEGMPAHVRNVMEPIIKAQ